MLHDKYCPKTISESVVNSNVIKQLKKYLTTNTTNHIFTLNGPHGSGKTVTISLILKDLQRKHVEINLGSQKITKSILEQRIHLFTKFSPDIIIVFEEIDPYVNDVVSIMKSLSKFKSKIIFVSIVELPVVKEFTYEKCTTCITNFKIYKKFISSINKAEKTKIKNIDTHIQQNKQNIRECINSLEYADCKDFTFLSIQQKIDQLKENDFSYSEKYNFLNNDSIHFIFMIHETLCNLQLSIKDRIRIQELIIDADILHTELFVSQNWECTCYLTNFAVEIVNIIQQYNIPLKVKNSNIWSLYSNICSKQLRINLLYEKCPDIGYSFQIFKYLQHTIKQCIIDKNNSKLCEVMKDYNLTPGHVTEIIQLNFVQYKLQTKNILKHIKS